MVQQEKKADWNYFRRRKNSPTNVCWVRSYTFIGIVSVAKWKYSKFWFHDISFLAITFYIFCFFFSFGSRMKFVFQLFMTFGFFPNAFASLCRGLFDKRFEIKVIKWQKSFFLSLSLCSSLLRGIHYYFELWHTKWDCCSNFIELFN